MEHICEIYKEYIRNIKRNIHKYSLFQNKWAETKNTEAPPSAAPPMGRPPHWVCDSVCDYFISYIINIYGYISYTFLIYSIYAYMFPRYVPCIFPCVFLNLWSQEKISPYSKTTFLLLNFQALQLLYFY